MEAVGESSNGLHSSLQSMPDVTQSKYQRLEEVSKAYETFTYSIRGATDLLEHFDRVNINPPPANAEVLKRASLVMALTALETYFEDRITEAVDLIAFGSSGGRLATFFKTSLAQDLKFFHTPSADRVRPLYEKYLGIDVSKGWTWNHYDSARAKSELNMLAEKRGDAVHRSPRPIGPVPAPHLVTREELRKHIQFVKDLVQATDKHLETIQAP